MLRDARALRLIQLDPLPGFCRLYRGVGHVLCAGAVMETGRTGTLVANGIDELPGLVITKGHERIALFRIARAARPAMKFLGDEDRFQSGPAPPPGLKFVPVAGDEHEAAFAAVDLDIIQAAPAL